MTGIGGKGDDDSEAWAHLKLGLREIILITAQREEHEELGDVFAAERWVLSWLGSGSLHDWYLADCALVVKHEDLVSHRGAPFSSCSEFIESGWYTAEEVRALVKESEKASKMPMTGTQSWPTAYPMKKTTS